MNFFSPGLLADETNAIDPNDPRRMGLLAMIAQGQGAGSPMPMQNVPQMPNSPGILAPDAFAQPAPNAPMPVARPSRYDLPQQIGGDFMTTTRLEGEPNPDAPAPGAVPAGGAPFNPPGAQKEGPGFLDRLTTGLGSIYGQGGPGDGLINLGLALMSPGNRAENLMKVGQMNALNDARKTQLQGAQLEQQKKLIALQGNMETLRKAYPNWSEAQLAAAAQSPQIVQEAVKALNPNEVWTTVTDPAERAQLGIAPGDTGLYQRDRTGKVQAIGTPKTEVNINQQAEKSLEVKRSEGLATRMNSIAEDANKASEDSMVLSRMGDLLGSVQTGRKTELLEKVRQLTGVALDPNTDNVQALNAAVQYLAPRLRVPGSGSQSDRELANFVSSIPNLAGTPGGNEKIMQTLAGLVEYRKQRADIALQWQVGDISAKEAQQKMDALPSPFAPKQQEAPAPGADGWTTINGFRVRKVN